MTVEECAKLLNADTYHVFIRAKIIFPVANVNAIGDYNSWREKPHHPIPAYVNEYLKYIERKRA